MNSTEETNGTILEIQEGEREKLNQDKPNSDTTCDCNIKQRPGVGVAVLLTSENHPNCVLIGKRKGGTGAGLYALPGGHLEFGEEWTECGERELLEETGLKVKEMKFATVVNTVVPQESYHHVTVFVTGEIDNEFKSKAENLEPEKCEGWFWCKWDDIPPLDQLFWALKTVREEGYHPFMQKRSGMLPPMNGMVSV